VSLHISIEIPLLPILECLLRDDEAFDAFHQGIRWLLLGRPAVAAVVLVHADYCKCYWLTALFVTEGQDSLWVPHLFHRRYTRIYTPSFTDLNIYYVSFSSICTCITWTTSDARCTQNQGAGLKVLKRNKIRRWSIPMIIHRLLSFSKGRYSPATVHTSQQSTLERRFTQRVCPWAVIRCLMLSIHHLHYLSSSRAYGTRFDCCQTQMFDI